MLCWLSPLVSRIKKAILGTELLWDHDVTHNLATDAQFEDSLLQSD